MASFEFEVEPELEGPVRRGYTGVVGPFGTVRVFRPSAEPGAEPLRQAVVSGEMFPAVRFTGGRGNVPSLDGGSLIIDEIAADLELRVKGVRKGSRWLAIDHLGRSYTYTAAGGTAHLKGDGVEIAIGRGRYIPGLGATRLGRVEGDASATDLAIALVLEEVETAVLTTSGALLAVPMNLLFGRQRDEGTI
ncbi:hypothetical protein [Streptomyces sediminimaris]|uniref:hypothetical protein n=1 Tax=Streptomyces sediminimaris TaxID=3383721 RepID=UPI003999B4E8